MPANFTPPGYRWFRFLRNAPIRVGLYTGVSLSLVFAAWILIANRAPLLEPLALQRNVTAAFLLMAIAAIPVLRFFRAPSDLLLSGLLAWAFLTFTHRILCLFFVRLDELFTTFHIFVLGALVYLIFATLSWIGIIMWRARAAQRTHSHR